MGTFDKSVGPNDLFTLAFIAEAAVAQFDLVKLGTSQWKVTPETASNSKDGIGVAQRAVAAGAVVPVRMLGTSLVVADDGNIAAGDYVKSGTTTKTRVISVATATANQNIQGRALQASNAAGDQIVIELVRIPGATVS